MRIYQRHSVWYVDYVFGGKRHRRSVGSREEAEAYLSKIKVDVFSGTFGITRDKHITVDDFIKKIAPMCKEKKSWATTYKYGFRAILAVFSGRILSSINSSEIREFHFSMRGEPYKANRTISIFHRIFNLAIEDGFVRENPVKVKRFEEKRRNNFLTREQVSKLLEHADDYMTSVIKFALGTGLRYSEMLRLEWEDIDFSQSKIFIKTQKVESAIGYVPMSDDICALMQFKRNYRPFKKPFYKQFKGRFHRLSEKAGVPCRIHDLRHTFASWLVQNKVPLYTVRDLLRHKSVVTTEIYAHLDNTSKLEAVNSIGTKQAQVEVLA